LNNIAHIPTLKEDVIATQKIDVGMSHIRRRLELGEVKCFREDADRVLRFKDHLVVLKDLELHCKIMDEAHCSRYSIHSGDEQDVSRLEEEFLVDKNEARDSKICD
jgi:hypothetical protein